MTDTSLALRHRPRTFKDIAGQKPVQLLLYHMIRLGRVPSAMLFAGNRGSGKTSTARIVGAALNCPVWPTLPEVVSGRSGAMPCGSCESCEAVAASHSVDVIEVDAASNGSVDHIRSLRESVRYEAAGEYRVVLLDEAHSMSPQAFNALLKTLEEPPENTIFVLLTTEPGKILPTVASRCMPFYFKRIAVPDIERRLRSICDEDGIKAEPELLRAIAEHSDGALRDALILLDQVSMVGISDAARFRAMHGDSDYAPKLIWAMADGDYGRVFGIVAEQLNLNGDYNGVQAKLVSCLKDILTIHCEGPTTVEGEALAARKALAQRVTSAAAAGAMEALWALATKVRLDPASSLDLALSVCIERLHPRPRAVPAPAVNGNGHMSLVASSRDSLAALGIRPA